MTLDEAIEHAKEIAKNECNECSKEHWMLVEWLSELRDRRKQDKSVYETSKLFKNREFIVLSKQDSDGDIREEGTLYLDQVIYSDYANEKVIEIDYEIDLRKSCETTIEVTPVLVIEY